jgi:hypothetical protein
VENWSPIILFPWSYPDLEEILRDALRVMEEIGLECTHQEFRHRLADWERRTIE